MKKVQFYLKKKFILFHVCGCPACMCIHVHAPPTESKEVIVSTGTAVLRTELSRRASSQCPSLLWPALPAQEKYPWALGRTLFIYSPHPQAHSIPYATFSTSILQTQTRNHILYTSPVPSVPSSTLPKPFPTSSPNLPLHPLF